IENLTIGDTYSSIKKCFDEVRSKCDILIGIYHGGFEYDLESHKQLSTTSENIAYKICKDFDFDILLTGHQHMPIGGQYLHGTYIAQTPHNASQFLELNLAFDENTKDKDITSQLNEIKLNPNKEIYDELLPIENKVQDWLDTPVGFLDSELHPSSHLDMALNGSILANFINQIQLEESGADISCTSFANSIKGFDKNVTVRDIMSTYMYPNTLVILEVTKKDLELALERCASYFSNNNGELSISDLFLKPKVEHYNYDYFANLEYTFDLNKEVGNRVTSIKFKGKELSDSDKLTLVMNNYRASGAGGYEFYCDCKIVREIMVEMPEVIIDYFRKNKNVNVDKSKYYNVVY
ncbi:MAG: bifunctional metallophosphatase/5'-nucleotidase, partial [Peptostreptococcaceae bacterium]